MVTEQLDPAAQHCWLADSSAQVIPCPRNRKEHLPLPRNGLFSALKLQAVSSEADLEGVIGDGRNPVVWSRPWGC